MKKNGIKLVKNGGFVALLVIFVIAINIFLNAIVSKYDLTLDLTMNQLYTLSDETKELMRGLDQEVNIYYITENPDSIVEFREMLERYDALSNKIHVRFINPNTDLMFIDEYQEKGVSIALNTMIVESGDSMKVITLSDMYSFSPDGSLVSFTGESMMTSAIMNVVNHTTNRVLLAMGHGEDTPSQLESTIVSYGYELTGYAFSGEITDDVKVLMILAPQSDYSEKELSYIDTFLSKGGTLLFFKDPQVKELPNLYGLLEDWGIGMNYDLVMDSAYNVSANPMYLIANYVKHDINTYFETHNYYVVTPGICSLSKNDNNAMGAEVSVVLATADSAYARDLESGDASLEKNTADINGPFILAAASQVQFPQADGSKETGKVFVIGSRRVYADDLLKSTTIGNPMYISELLQWGVGEESATYSIAGKLVGSESLTITATQIRILAILLIGVIPAIVLIYGVVVVMQRRYL